MGGQQKAPDHQIQETKYGFHATFDELNGGIAPNDIPSYSFRKARKNSTVKNGNRTTDDILRAINIQQNGVNLRKAAKYSQIPYPRLRRYVLKYKNNPKCSLIPNYEVRAVFTPQQENYVIECAQKCYGISANEVRRIAYQMAKVNNIQMPSTWITNEKTGKEVFRFFKQRHPELTVRVLQLSSCNSV